MRAVNFYCGLFESLVVSPSNRIRFMHKVVKTGEDLIGHRKCYPKSPHYNWVIFVPSSSEFSWFEAQVCKGRIQGDIPASPQIKQGPFYPLPGKVGTTKQIQGKSFHHLCDPKEKFIPHPAILPVHTYFGSRAPEKILTPRERINTKCIFLSKSLCQPITFYGQ